MATKRMFSLQIVDSDAFLDMPASSQLLYFHLAMRADDEGFIGNAKKIMRSIGGNEDDLKILIAKRFVLSFENSVLVIKHWLIHNTLRQDRIVETSYTKEKSLILVKSNKSYTERHKLNAVNMPSIDGQDAAEVRLGKDRIGKDRVMEIAEQSSGQTKKWEYQEILREMQESEKPIDRMLSYFWNLKNFNFENSKELSLQYGRDCKPAKRLLESGYSKEKIKKGFEYVSKKYADVDWNISTVTRFMAEANR